MGSVFEKEQHAARPQKRQLKSKGERLGWKSRSEIEYKSVRESVGRGEVVSASYCFMSCAFKLIP